MPSKKSKQEQAPSAPPRRAPRNSRNYTYLRELPMQTVPVKVVREKRQKSPTTLPAGELLRRNLIHILRTQGFKTFEQFSHTAGFSKSTLSQITRERRDPRLSTLEKLANFLGIPLHCLFLPPFPLPADWDDL